MKRLKVLISAYTCSPYKGSEPGVGWNFVYGISKYHEVHVIVERKKWKKDIEKFIKENPGLEKNIKFYFIKKKRNKFLRKIWPPSYYWFYKRWQKEAFKLAVELNKKENFDLTHHLTMVGFREPGYLWQINSPFVWGPIGGLEITPWRFLTSMGLKGFIYFAGRNILNLLQKKTLKRPKNAAQRKRNMLIAATPGNANEIEKLWGKRSQIICEVGQVNQSKTFKLSHRKTNMLRIVWSGVHEPHKNLGLLLKALSKSKAEYELHIMGKGTETRKWKKLSVKLGISNKCKWHGWLEREKSFSVFNESHLFCITSLKDLTSTVTLEALSFGLPIICLDHCGFSEVVNESCGVKIPLTTPRQVIVDFSNAIERLYYDEELRFTLAKGAIKRANDFSWEKKIEEINNIYFSLLNNSNEQK